MSSLPSPPVSSLPPGSSLPSLLAPVPATPGVRGAVFGAMLIVLGVTLFQVWRAQAACEGSFTYASDGAYQHLSLARTVAWGSKEKVQIPRSSGPALSASASPGWTLGLAGLLRVSAYVEQVVTSQRRLAGEGVNNRFVLLLPLLTNLFAVVLFVMVAGHCIRPDVQSVWGMLGYLLAICLLMPVPLIVLVGMEHLLHAVVLLAMVAVCIHAVECNRVSLGQRILVTLLAAAAISLRYESLAALVAMFLWGWMRTRRARVALPLAAGLAVVLAMGVYLVLQGSWFLPDAVVLGLLGSATGSWAGWMAELSERIYGNLRSALVLTALVLIASGLLWSRRDHLNAVIGEERTRVAWLFVFVVTGVLHLLIGRTGGYFRYEAYLVPIGAIAILRGLTSRSSGRWSWWGPAGIRRVAMACACLLPIAMVSLPVAQAAWTAPELSGDVYRRHRTMASFIRSYFDNAGVAVNETGVISYETQARVVDLSGVTDHDIAASLVADNASREILSVVCDTANVQVAMITDPVRSVAVWPIEIPLEWEKVGGWRVTLHGVQEPETTVKVYAVSPDTARDVKIAFRDFVSHLPRGTTKLR